MPDSTVATRSDEPLTLAAILESPNYKKRFTDVLGHRAPQFISSLLSVSNAEHLRDADPRSIVAAAMVAASLDLPINPNLGFAHIVPYKQGDVKIAQFQMGYKGFIQLAMRTGKYRFINACTVREGELERYDKLTGELVLKAGFDEAPVDDEKEKIIGYASYFRMLNGFEHALYMTRAQCDAHGKKYSQTYKRGFGKWKDDFDAMALKTVIKLNLSKWGMLSVQMERALGEDQSVRFEPDASPMFPDNAGPPIDRPQIKDVTPPGQQAPAGDGKTEGTKRRGRGAGKQQPQQSDLAPKVGPNETEMAKRLDSAGKAPLHLVRVAIKKGWIKTGPDQVPSEITLSDIGEEKLGTFLKEDLWPAVAGEMDELE